MNTLKLAPLYRRSVGFDHFADMLESLTNNVEDSTSNYPPYNIEKYDDERYGITMAVAGFSPDNLDIEQVKNELTIKGSAPQSDHAEPHYLHKGIAQRSFVQRFRLADNVEVGSATIENGLLAIELRRLVPEAAKPRKISICQTAESTKPAHATQSVDQQAVGA